MGRTGKTLGKDFAQQATGALAGVRVVEWGTHSTAPYAAKLLADLGADVIKIEELPNGDPSRVTGPFPDGRESLETSGMFHYLNTGKRGALLDLGRTDDRKTFEKLVASADMLIHNQPSTRLASMGLAYEDLIDLNPGLVCVAVTPFGLTGPYRDWRACNMVVSHLAGLGKVTHWAGLDPERVPPQRPAGQFVDLTTGATAAIAALAGLFARDVQGSPQLVDVSAWETGILATFPNMLYPTYEDRGLNFRRPHLTARAPMGYMRCQDGYFWAAVLQPRHWESFTALLGVPELAAEPLFATPMSRGQYWDVLEPILASKIAAWPKEKLFHACQAVGIPIVPVYGVDEVLQSEQLRSRNFMVELTHPALGTFSMPSNPCGLPDQRIARRPAPALGQHTTEIRERSWGVAPRRSLDLPTQPDRLPLSGVRVLDFSWVLAGPLCTQLLAHLGAEVIKVESERIPDIARTNPPFAGGREHPELSGFYASLAAGKRTVTLDLATPEGLALAKDLVRQSDVVVENFSPGTFSRLGLGYQELKRLRPDTILVSVSGVGQTGPLSMYRYFGLQIFAMSGLSVLSSPPDMPPAVTRAGGADPLAAIYATLATLAALEERRRTGRGQRIDVSMLEVTLAHLPDAIMDFSLNGRVPEATGNAEGANTPVDCFRCRGEDAWVAIAVHDEFEWAGLCRAIGKPTLATDPLFADASARARNSAELSRCITEWTMERSPSEAMRLLQAEGVPAGASFDVRDALADPHIRERGFMEPVDHHDAGIRFVAGVPWKISGVPLRASPQGVPKRNADFQYVLGDLLGLRPEAIGELISKRVTPGNVEAA